MNVCGTHIVVFLFFLLCSAEEVRFFFFSMIFLNVIFRAHTCVTSNLGIYDTQKWQRANVRLILSFEQIVNFEIS